MRHGSGMTEKSNRNENSMDQSSHVELTVAQVISRLPAIYET
jgi:hypothetical protein